MDLGPTLGVFTIKMKRTGGYGQGVLRSQSPKKETSESGSEAKSSDKKQLKSRFLNKG